MDKRLKIMAIKTLSAHSNQYLETMIQPNFSRISHIFSGIPSLKAVNGSFSKKRLKIAIIVHILLNFIKIPRIARYFVKNIFSNLSLYVLHQN